MEFERHGMQGFGPGLSPEANELRPRSFEGSNISSESALQTQRRIQGRMWAMGLDQAVDLVRHTLILALLVSAPMLLIGLCVSIIVSLLQTVTQIQEQTLTF